MLYWIKKFSFIIAVLCFFVLFFIGVDVNDPFNVQVLLIAAFKGFCGAILVWFVLFVIGDITFKGVIDDVPESEMDQIEGGILQRISDSKKGPAVKDVTPGMKIVEVGSEAQGKKKGKKKKKK